MLAGIIRTFLTASLAGSLAMGGMAVATLHEPARSPAHAMEAARAVTFVTSGNAFPLLVRDAEAVAQLRDILQTLDGPLPADETVQAALADMDIAPARNPDGLLAQARELLQRARQLLALAAPLSGQPATLPAQTALDDFNTLLIRDASDESPET